MCQAHSFFLFQSAEKQKDLKKGLCDFHVSVHACTVPQPDFLHVIILKRLI